MYSIRCKVFHDEIGNAMGLYESRYVILVDTPKLRTAFDISERAMNEKYPRYEKHNFKFSIGAQRVDGHLNDRLFQILLTE
jgi:hypothetical protein